MTSSNSGLPKAAVVNHNRLLAVLAVLSSNGVTADDVVYLNLPLYHTAGFFIGFIGSIETGEIMLNCRASFGLLHYSHILISNFALRTWKRKEFL